MNGDLVSDEDYELNEPFREEVRSNNSLISGENEWKNRRYATSKFNTIDNTNTDNQNLNILNQNNLKLNPLLCSTGPSRENLLKYGTSRTP